MQRPELSPQRLSQGPTDVSGQLLGGVRGELGNLEDHVTVGLHRGPGDRAQPVVSHVVQLRKLITWKREGGHPNSEPAQERPPEPLGELAHAGCYSHSRASVLTSRWERPGQTVPHYEDRAGSSQVRRAEFPEAGGGSYAGRGLLQTESGVGRWQTG